MANHQHDRIQRASDLATVAATAKYLGNLLARACDCPRAGCTVGVHIFHATRDTRPGIKAQAFDEERVNGSRTVSDTIATLNEKDDHDELRRLAASINANCIALATMVAAQQHDRQRPTETHSDEEWCRHHLDIIKSCEPRYRGDLCRRCYDLHLSTGVKPTKQILETWHRGDRVTTAMVNTAKAEAKAAKKRKRRKRK